MSRHRTTPTTSLFSVGESVDDRWAAVKPSEREAFPRYGMRPAPGESPPDYAERILKADPKITLSGAASVANVFRAAYDALTDMVPSR